jgi:YidC/Oxa1 family membrane protein insertase
LNFIYYPVSFILWCWHWVFGLVFGPSNAFGWALSIVFLVFTLRVILLKPAISQIRSMRKMAAFAPEIKKLQKKYANDKQRQAQEMQKLQREHGVNPLGGCLPMVLQVPVFIGLNHVLRSFQNPNIGNYFFSAHDVKTYLDADLFGAHLGDAILGIGSWGGTPGWHWSVAPVAIPLMIAAAVATHFTARLSVNRQISTNPQGTPQSEIMQKITLWLFPLGVLVFGGALPVGLLLYWLSNNGWTLGQQHFVFKRIDKEEAAKKVEVVEQRAALAPKVGQKPTQVRRRPANAVGTTTAADTDTTTATEPAGTKPSTATKPAVGAKPATGTRPAVGAKPAAGTKPAAGAKPAAGTKPAPGAKPAVSRKPAPGTKPAAGAKPTAGAKPVGAKPAAGAAPAAGAKSNGAKPAAKIDGTKSSNTRAAQSKADGSANGTAGNPEIPGLVAGRSRRNKQDRKGS